MAQPKRQLNRLPNPEDASRAILKLLERISDGRSTMDHFKMFIEACNVALDELPTHLNQPSFVASPAWHEAGLDKISQQCYQTFAEGFAILLSSAVDSEGNRTYKDVVGPVYMGLLEGARWNSDQFYTPSAVAEMMAMISLPDVEAEFYSRCRAAIDGDPLLQAVVLAAGLTAMAFDGQPETDDNSHGLFLSHVWPVLKEQVQPFTVCDPCVGSGVLLLAAAKQIPRWLIDIGFVRFFGTDVQHIAVRMCQLNCKLYSLH